MFLWFWCSWGSIRFSKQRYAQVTTVQTGASCKNKCEGKKKRIKQPNSQTPQVAGTLFVASSRYNGKYIHFMNAWVTQLLNSCFVPFNFLFAWLSSLVFPPYVSLMTDLRKFASIFCVISTLPGFENRKDKKDMVLMHRIYNPERKTSKLVIITHGKLSYGGRT